MEPPIQSEISWTRIAADLAWPALLPILSIAAWLMSPWAFEEVHPSFPAVFAVLWVIVVVLGWRLHRTRMVFASFSLGVLFEGFLIWGAPEHLWALQMGGSLVFALLMVIFGFSGDRGLTTPSGAFRLIALIGGSCLAAWFCLPEQVPFVESLYGPLLPFGGVPVLQVPQLAVFIVVISGMALAIQFTEKRGAIESSMIGTLIAGECAIWEGLNTPDAMIWFIGGQLILVLGLMEGFHSLAYKDELTGLPGRRAMNELMDQLNGSFAICMIDVDHFKKFNDRYGHDAGDEVLRMVAGQIGQVGLGGRAFRFGGEEFTVVFSGKTASRVEEELERIREAIAGRAFVFRGMGRPRQKPDTLEPVRRPRKSAQVTVSLGLADSKGGRVDTISVLKKADENLYRAKDAGRNALIW